MKGKVYLIGAGPGDYELLTLKGINCIKNADVVVYDRLANDSFLKETKKGCEFIYVGKESKNHTKTQQEINEIIAEEALKGKIVARLKGGDPYVFGRGGEEAEFLLEKGVEFQVVPGITSAIGGLCYAGIPITHRDYASSFHVITGHLKEEDKQLNFKVLSKLEGTLVFLMGMANLKNICNNLITYGKAKNTPVAIINWATRPYQKVVTGTLETIYDIAKEKEIKSPSLIVVGQVVNLRDKLNFFEKKPLFSKNIMVTRARTQSSRLIEKLRDLGANVIEFPTIKIEEIIPNEPLDNSIKSLKEYSYVIFTSINAVNIFFKRLMDLGFDSRLLANTKIVAIGSSTARELKKYGLRADLVPEKFVAEELIEELKTVVHKEDKILIPRSSEARKILVEKLSELCFVKEVKIYNTKLENQNSEEILNLLEKGSIDYITFTSSSTVKNLVKILGEENLKLLNSVKLMSIGPITSKTINSMGLKVYRQAEEFTIDGLIESLLD